MAGEDGGLYILRNYNIRPFLPIFNDLITLGLQVMHFLLYFIFIELLKPDGLKWHKQIKHIVQLVQKNKLVDPDFLNSNSA